ncbi:LOW QUALITY PROTEIN: death-inducer obliterator 1 [Sinocyclocheilus grahami]|uniref:LOW QUALITY PROTEIN: death-inducer obliterator 1 n=1 Tax=Sinocyclocheilus grahami TaxID=75366 RepID=UPI0007ACD84D|nr:PREDICTED: LOW QUALITY PROTEIN: death-inducer obliterator 1 [Sinocyclocheilus grahami]
MDEEGSSSAAMTRSWGFRRSTLARREFMQAVGSVDSSLPVQRRRGRGRGRGADESGRTPVASKRGRGCAPVHTPAGDLSSENEARETVPCEERLSEGVPSDRAEDSDDLNLQEIRKRAVARKLQELKHDDDAAAKGTEDIDVGLSLLMEREEIVSEDTDITSGGGKVCSSTATGAGGTSVAAAGAREATAGGRAEEDHELAEEEQEEFSENSKEDTERMNPDAVCCTCQQGHSNRLMCCDCVGVAETCAHLLQRNREYACPSCSDDWDSTRSNGPSEKHEIDSTCVVEIEQPVEEEVKAEEKAALPKCIGPGCSNDSLPESVYCGHQCIVRHAAAAMKSLSEPKIEPADPPLKSEKRSFLAKLFKVKISKLPAQEERVSKQELDEESLCSATVIESVQSTTPSSPAPEYKPTVKEKDEVECSISTPQSQPSDLTPDVSSSEKTPAAPLIKKSTPGRAKKTMPGSPRLELLKGALSKSPLSIPKKPCESKAPVESSKVVLCGPWAEEPAVAPHASPLLMRQSIRRSLSTLLCRRFSQSDDLKISESEIEKMAVDMEKEMFNMCYTTDEEYKNKYQYLVLTLKDPQNKELCHQVLKGNMPSVKLIQLSQQEESAADPLWQISKKKESSLFSEDVEEPADPPEKVMSVDTTTSPSATTPSEEKSSLKLPQAKEISLGAPDVTSCMLKDTTAEHKRHLFDLNCRICTGQVSTDDPETKKPKMTMTKENSLKLPQEKEISLGAPDVTSCMLKDTTAEHKRHLFDLNCRICTGQVSTDDPETKKPKMTMTKDETEKEKSSGVVHVIDEALYPPALDSDIFESPASPSGEDLNSQIPSADFSPVLIPSVPTVSISRRDPRTAQYRQAPPLSAVSESASIPQQHPHPVKNAPESLKETLPPHVSVPLPAPMPKSILMKPPPASLDTSYGSMTRLADCDKGTKQFLSKQSILWKGFLNMPTVAKFVTKGYLISGSPDLLKEDLPDTIHIGGRILPQTVWEYVDLIKTSEAKELSLIRFHPSSEEEEVAYVSLFSYFNSRRRFGVVSNICKHIKDLYLIPLSTKQSIPAVLLPIEGPGLEQNHPNLLIGLAVCQKPKRPEGLPQDVGEKNSRSLMCSDGKGTSNPTSLNDPGQHSIKACDADIFLDSNPAGSLPSVGLPDPSCSASSLCAPSSLPSVSNPTPSVTVGPSKDSTSTTPLQTILNTLFGQKKQPSDVTECKIISLTDTVQICQQTCKDDDAMILGDDRPYDPEEYDPACSNGAMGSFSPVLEPKVLEPKGPSAVADDDDDDRPYDPEEEYSAVGDTVRNNTPKASEAKHMEETSTFTSDIAYDPEDETMFEEMQSYLTSNAIPHKSTFCENNMSHYKDNTSVTTFSEQQKILEELNRQIEEQKRQLEEQTETLRLQKEAIGVSMAHFSVSKALMSPTHFDRDEEESIENIPYCQIIHQNRDPRTCRNTSQDMPFDDTECEAIDKESTEKLLNTEEATNVVLNKSFTTKKEKLASDKAMPKEVSPDTKSAQLKNTKCSHSEYTHKNQDSRRSTLSTYRSSRRKSWHEHGSHHQDGASSRASRTVRSSKDVSDKHHRSKHSARHLSRGCYSDEKGVTTSRKRHYHHHRDSSSPPRYRMRRHYSPVSHSSRRDKSSHDDSDQSRKTDLSEHITKSSQHESGQVPDSDGIQSAYASGQSVKVEGEAANGKDKRLAEVQKGGPPNTKHEADRNQGLQTFQNPGEGSSQPLLNKSIDKNLPLSVLSEMKRENLPPNQTDSSNQGALLPTRCLAQGATDLPLHRDSPALQPSGIQTDVFHHDTQPPHNQTDRFSESGQIDQKRNMSSMQRPNYSHNETDQLHSGDYPQRAFRLQYRNSSQSDTDQLYSRELPQNKRGKFLHDGDNNKQPYVSHKQEEFSTGKCVHQKHPNHRLRRFPVEPTDQVHQSQQPTPDQLHECNFEEPETAGLCHKKYTSYKQGQNFHEDESVQFQQRESLLGPPPVHKGNFRPPNPREHFHPSTFDKWKPLREHPSVMKLRSPEFAQPRDGNSGSSTNFGPRGQSSGFVRYEGPTKDPQPSGPFTEEMFESPGPARPIGSKDPSPRQRSFRRVRGSHRGSRQVMHDRTHLMNSSKQMSIPNVEGPTERQTDTRDLHTTPTSKSHMPHLANPSGYSQDICELHSPACHQTFAEDAEDRIRTGFSRWAQSHSQDTAHGPTHSQFEGQQYTEIKGQPRGLQRFRGRRRGIVGPFYARDHKNNAQVRGPRFDSPQPFLGQREPSLDLHRRRRPSPQNCDGFDDHNETHSSDFPDHSTTTPTHFTKPQHQHLGQPPANLECRLRQTNIRPLRLSGPLLPTPPGGPIRQNLSLGHGQNSHNVTGTT